jgi:hypothetical protein
MRVTFTFLFPTQLNLICISVSIYMCACTVTGIELCISSKSLAFCQLQPFLVVIQYIFRLHASNYR